MAAHVASWGLGVLWRVDYLWAPDLLAALDDGVAELGGFGRGGNRDYAPSPLRECHSSLQSDVLCMAWRVLWHTAAACPCVRVYRMLLC